MMEGKLAVLEGLFSLRELVSFVTSLPSHNPNAQARGLQVYRTLSLMIPLLSVLRLRCGSC